MELAGKYKTQITTGYTPDAFPDQRFMQEIAKQSVNDPEVRNAALQFQYPFRIADLKNSNYSARTKEIIINALEFKVPRWPV
jgi:hypothetical protein